MAKIKLCKNKPKVNIEKFETDESPRVEEAHVEMEGDDLEEDNELKHVQSESALPMSVDEAINNRFDTVINEHRERGNVDYQIQVRLPRLYEPMYKSFPSSVKRALRDAFGDMIELAYHKLRSSGK